MCGISAVIKSDINPDGNAITQMVKRLSHRGPDANGCVHLLGCHLGNTRLSIIDLNTGDQPMSDATGRYWITFNGEIYNYQQLREKLLKKGYCFKTQSDTEVIMAAYAEWGLNCLHRFRGMFAFGIWDTKQRQLFAARDILGEKPLYYTIATDGSLLIASEIKAIIASGIISPRLSLEAVDAYLALGYIPPHRTIYENIQVLPPGHFLLWDSGQVTIYKYWSVRFDNRAISIEEASEHLQELLKQAVRRQTIADVPVGAFLSGGLDSSTIVALMQQYNHKSITTFSVGFGNYINELDYARLVAKKYHTQHHEIDLGDPPVGELFERMVAIFDEPFADSSNIPTYLISEYAKEFVKVVLSGDGGDELLGGYCWYPKLAISEQVSGSWAKWVILRLLSRLMKERIQKLCTYSVAVGLAYKWQDIWMRSVMFNKHLKYEQRQKLWGDRNHKVPGFIPDGYYFPPAETFGLNRAFYFDFSSYLPGDILVKVDRAAMAHGLETRMPFLDRDVVEFALSLPARLKVENGQTKVILRHMAGQYWPTELKTRDKQGFSVPSSTWLKRPDIQALAHRVFKNGSALRNLLPGLNSSQSSIYQHKTWILLTLGAWLEYHNVSA